MRMMMLTAALILTLVGVTSTANAQQTNDTGMRPEPFKIGVQLPPEGSWWLPSFMPGAKAADRKWVWGTPPLNSNVGPGPGAPSWFKVSGLLSVGKADRAGNRTVELKLEEAQVAEALTGEYYGFPGVRVWSENTGNEPLQRKFALYVYLASKDGKHVYTVDGRVAGGLNFVLPPANEAIKDLHVELVFRHAPNAAQPAPASQASPGLTS